MSISAFVCVQMCVYVRWKTYKHLFAWWYVYSCVFVCVRDAHQIVIFSSSELASLLKQRFLSPIQDHNDQPSAFDLNTHQLTQHTHT